MVQHCFPSMRLRTALFLILCLLGCLSIAVASIVDQSTSTIEGSLKRGARAASLFRLQPPFYADAVHGNDANNGTAPQWAWKTLVHACDPNLSNSTSVGTVLNLLSGQFNVTSTGCTTWWNFVGNGMSTVTLNLQGTLTFAAALNLSGATVQGNVLAAGSPAVYFYGGGYLVNTNWHVTSGTGLVSNGTFEIDSTNLSYSTPSYVYASAPGVWNFINGQSTTLKNVTISGGRYGGGAAISVSGQPSYLYANTLTVTNHVGDLPAIFLNQSFYMQITGATFQNNLGTGSNSSCIGWVDITPNTQVPLYVKRASVDVLKGDLGEVASYARATLTGVVFQNNSCANGGGAIQALHNVPNAQSPHYEWTITNSVFRANTGAVGAVWLANTGGSLTMSNVTFDSNVGSVFSAIYLFNVEFGVNIDVSQFTNNMVPFAGASSAYVTSTVFLLTSGGGGSWDVDPFLSNTLFNNNTAPYCPHLVLYNVTGMVLRNNQFLSATSNDTASVCISGRDPFLSLHDPILLELNTFSDTTFLAPNVDYMTTSTQLNLWDNDFVISTYVLGNTNYAFSSIAIGNCSTLQIYPTEGFSSIAFLPGLISYTANISLYNCTDVYVLGRTSFLTMLDSNGHIDPTTTYFTSLLSAGATLHIEDYIAPGADSSLPQTQYDITQTTWIQDVTFINVTLELSHPAVFCCNDHSLYTNVNFYGSNLHIVFGYHWFLRANSPTNFYPSGYAPAGAITIYHGVTVDAAYPIKDYSQESRMVIGGSVYNYGTFKIVDAIITGDLGLYYASSQLVLYPSLWGGHDHRIVVEGNFYPSGSILLDEKLAQLPFLPLISYSPQQTYTLMESPNIISVDYSTFGSWFYRYNVGPSTILANQSVIGTAGHGIVATPLSLIPYSFIDNTGSAIWMQFAMPPSTSYSCGDLISATSTQFDPNSLTCHWQSDTILRIGSATLPTQGQIVSMKPGNVDIGTPYYGLQAAVNASTPIAIIRPVAPNLPCATNLTLDASISIGIGSYPGIFNWSLTTGTTDPSTSALASFLASQHSPVVILNPSYFLVGYSYAFQVNVTNWAGLTSQQSNATIVTRVNPPLAGFQTQYPPQVSIDGPPVRTHFVGSDLTLTAHLVVDTCINPDQVLFAWKDSMNNTVSLGPSLFIPGSDFTQPGALYLFLQAGYSSNLAVHSMLPITINVTAAPFFLVQESPTYFYDTMPFVSVDFRGFNSSGATMPPAVSWQLMACPSIDGRQARVQLSGASSGQDGAVSTTITQAVLVPTCIEPNGVSFPVDIAGSNTPNASISNFNSIMYGTYILQATMAVTTNRGIARQAVNVSFTFAPAPTTLPPAVRIHLPTEFSVVAPTNRVYFQAVVGNLVGVDILLSYTLQWTIFSGVVNVSSLVLDQPNLVIPYTNIMPGQYIEVMVTATSLLSPFVQANYSTVFASSTPPFGGQLFVTPTSGSLGTTFSFSSSPWSALYPPMKYQFSLVSEGDSSSSDVLILTDPLDVPSFTANLSLPVVDTLGSSQVTMLATLTVTDAVGCHTTSQVPIVFHIDNSTISDAALSSLLNQMQQAVNNSDWKTGSSLLDPIVRALVQREIDGSLINNATALALEESNIDTLITCVNELASTLPLNQVNTAGILRRIESAFTLLFEYASLNTNHSDVLENMLWNALESNHSSFGTSTTYSYLSSTSLINTAALIAANSAANARNSSSPSQSTSNGILSNIASLLDSHGSLFLDNMVPGEDPVTHTTDGLAFSAHHRTVLSGGVSVQPDGFGTQVNFSTSQYSSSSPSGYLGYHHVIYNGTYPNLPANATLGLVSVLTVVLDSSAYDTENGIPASKRSLNAKREALVSTSSLTTFNTSSAPTAASCATYDSATQTWTTSGCTTSTDSSSVTCDCSSSSGTALTVLFGDSITPTASTPPSHPPSPVLIIPIGPPSAPNSGSPNSPSTPSTSSPDSPITVTPSGTPSPTGGSPTSSPSSPPSGSSSLSFGTLGVGGFAAIIAVIGAVIVAGAVVTIVVFAVPKCRQTVVPYRGTNA